MNDITAAKVSSRALQMKVVRDLRDGISSTGLVLSLAGRLRHPHSEIRQYVEDKFCRMDQYIGIDANPTITADNKAAFPEHAEQFICTKLERFVLSFDMRCVELINADTEHLADRHASNLAVRLLSVARSSAAPGCVVLVNAMMVSSHNSKRFTEESFLSRLGYQFADLSDWMPAGKKLTIPYCGTGTAMTVFVFQKPYSQAAHV